VAQLAKFKAENAAEDGWNNKEAKTAHKKAKDVHAVAEAAAREADKNAGEEWYRQVQANSDALKIAKDAFVKVATDEGMSEEDAISEFSW
jgi:hypothetical protein